MTIQQAPSFEQASTTISDESIAAEATARLWECSYLFSPNMVECRCSDGVLTIQGHVRTYYQKQVAQTLVSGMEGVTWILNRLEVCYPRIAR